MADSDLAVLEKERTALQKKLKKQEAELVKAMAAAKDAAKKTADAIKAKEAAEADLSSEQSRLDAAEQAVADAESDVALASPSVAVTVQVHTSSPEVANPGTVSPGYPPHDSAYSYASPSTVQANT